MQSSSKELGCCTICGKCVFEVLERFPNDHRLAKRICRVGRALPSARRATLVLASGIQASITLCDQCKIIPANLPDVWTTCVVANAAEVDPEYRVAIGAHVLSEEQSDRITDGVAAMVSDLPMAVITMEKWEEVNGGS